MKDEMLTATDQVIYDIFGFFPQTLQGADILAHGDKEHHYQVFIPDFFDGKPADISWYPPDTKEKGEKLGQYVSSHQFCLHTYFLRLFCSTTT